MIIFAVHNWIAYQFSVKEKLNSSKSLTTGPLYYWLSVADLHKSVYAEPNNIIHNFNINPKAAALDCGKTFLRQYPSVAVPKAEEMCLNKVSGFNKENIRHLYNVLGNLIENYRCALNIYNADDHTRSSHKRHISKKKTCSKDRQYRFFRKLLWLYYYFFWKWGHY